MTARTVSTETPQNKGTIMTPLRLIGVGAYLLGVFVLVPAFIALTSAGGISTTR